MLAGRRRDALDGRLFGITSGQIDIGNDSTALLREVGDGAGHLQPDGTVRVEPTFAVEEAARTIVFVARMPSDAVIGSITITAAGMPFDGRG